MTPEQRLADLGIVLPKVPKPRWAYAPAVRTGNLVFVSGQIATEGGRILHPGKLGREVDVERGREAARGCAIAALAVVRQAGGGSLDNVVRVVKLTVFVASAEGFGEQPTVANGASELLRDVFGDQAGLGARSAVGVAELPLGASVEAEFVFEVANTAS
jgi:enamine deaminase RidA (YjgF/YER057c/UK114 family)